MAHYLPTPVENSPVYSLGVDYERRDIDISKDVARLLPDATPFLVVLMRARKKNTRTAEFKWYDSEPGGWWTQTTDAVEADQQANVIPCTTSNIFRPKDIVKVPVTGEVLFVTDVSDEGGTKEITVVRGYGGTTVAQIPMGAWLQRMGNAMEEFSQAPQPKITQPIKEFNYTQIFRRPFDQSMTSDAEALRTNETERTRLRRDQLIEHRMDIERAMLFGVRHEDVLEKRRMTGGLDFFIKTNVMDAQSDLTEHKFEEFCEMLFAHGSSRKLLICSYRTGSIINNFAKHRIQTESGDRFYGLRIKRYESYHGDLYIVPSRVLEKEYRGVAFGVDMDYIFYRPLQGRDTKLKTNIQANDADGWRDEYLTEVGLQVRLEKVHAKLLNCDATESWPSP